MFTRLAALSHARESRQLARLEQADRQTVAKYSSRALAEILLWSKRRVPYYRSLLKEVSRNQIRRFPERVLADLPPLEKSDLHRHFESLSAEASGIRGVRVNASGGSTGQTARFLQDTAYRRWNRAVLARYESWAGWRHGQSRILLWGLPRDVESAARPLNRFRDRLLKRFTLNAYNMSPETMKHYAECIQRIRPGLLRVFTQSGAEFARYILDQDMAPLPVGSVTCSGAMLKDEYRANMEEAFGTGVFNSYGSREVGPIAAEKDRGHGLLVSPATHRLEILDEHGRHTAPGEEGEIHVTLLVNHAMPLIRYRIGDRGAWKEDATTTHGPHWPSLKALTGRTMEHLVAQDGTLRNSQLMSELVMHVSWIAQFQWIQHARDRLELRLALQEPGPDRETLQRFKKEMEHEAHHIIGPDCTVDITLHDHIAPGPSGKYHYVLCRVQGRGATSSSSH